MKKIRALNRFELWVANNAGAVLLATAVVMTLVAVAIVYLAVSSLDERAVLQGVRHAGPCRAEGIKDSECRRQSRLIFKACSDQPVHCAEVFGIEVRPWIKQQRAAPPPVPSPGSHTTTAAPAPRDPGGGGAHQPKGNQQPSPGSQPGHDDSSDHGQEAPPASSPSPSGSEKPGGGPPPSGPSNAPQEPPGGGSSGAGAEVCAAGACAKAEVGLPDLPPKGPLP